MSRLFAPFLMPSSTCNSKRKKCCRCLVSGWPASSAPSWINPDTPSRRAYSKNRARPLRSRMVDWPAGRTERDRSKLSAIHHPPAQAQFTALEDDVRDHRQISAGQQLQQLNHRTFAQGQQAVLTDECEVCDQQHSQIHCACGEREKADP